MSQKSKVLVSCITPLLVTFLAVQSTFAASALKQGMTGNSVTGLQKDLISLGIMKSDATGYYGDITKAAVQQFQKKYGLSADGIAGTKTLAKIDALQGAKTTASRGTTAAAGSVNLKTGMRGAAVTELQKGLKKLGFMSIEPTGYFGDTTKAAVKAFQKKYGLTQDGVAGKQTIGKIDDLAGTSTATKAVSTPVSRGSAGQAVSNLIEYAKNFLGVRYRWGGTTAKGFDCSGFTSYVFKKFGITLNRVSSSQTKNGTYIKKANLLPGDLVFFDTNGGSNRINHVGIYIGSGKFIHASSGHSSVTISSLSSGFYANAYMTARRVL